MARKKISQNKGESGRINLSGSELDQFDAEVGDAVSVDIAESEEIAHAMIDSKDTSNYIIITKVEKHPTEGDGE